MNFLSARQGEQTRYRERPNSINVRFGGMSSRDGKRPARATGPFLSTTNGSIPADSPRRHNRGLPGEPGV